MPDFFELPKDDYRKLETPIGVDFDPESDLEEWKRYLRHPSSTFIKDMILYMLEKLVVNLTEEFHTQ